MRGSNRYGTRADGGGPLSGGPATPTKVPAYLASGGAPLRLANGAGVMAVVHLAGARRDMVSCSLTRAHACKDHR